MRAQYLPILVTILAAAALGLFWIPLRALAENGLPPRWATVIVFSAPVLVLLPFALWRRGQGLHSGARYIVTGGLTGGALAFYSESLLLTDVARALILFYVTPVWSTLLEVSFLKQRLTKERALALVLGFAGLIVILGGRTGIPLPQNSGDVMALLAGMLWACGSIRVRMTPGASIFETVFSFFLYSAATALLLAHLPTLPAVPLPDWTVLKPLLPWLLLIGAGFLIPIMSGVLWGSQHIDAGRLGILLQIEAVVGIGSAAVLTNEPFGFVEMTGATLIIGAGAIDVFGSRDATSKV